MTLAVVKERAEYNPIWREINTICLVDKKEQAADADGETSDDEQSLTALAAALAEAASDK